MDDNAEAQQLLTELSDPPENATKAWFQARGRRLEGLIQFVLRGESLEPRLNIRPSGEELDGSFALDGRIYLLEAKWRGGPTPASDLYAFKGKVDGKLTGTIGVFITMNRYSPDAVSALQVGKVVNLILFSAEDFRSVVEGRLSFADAMRRKLRYAAEVGGPYLPLQPLAEGGLATRSPSFGTEGPGTKSWSGSGPSLSWDVVVESRSDERGIRTLFDRLVSVAPIHLRYWAAEGAANLPGVVRRLVDANGPDRVVAFVDRDLEGDRMRSLLESQVTIVPMDPHLEGWLTLATPNEVLQMPPPFAEKEMLPLGRHADIGQLRAANPSFDALLRKMRLLAQAD